MCFALQDSYSLINLSFYSSPQGIQTDLAADGSVDPRSVDVSQLHQSRFGLISQALMLILIAGFLASETLSEFWKTK